MRDAQENVQEIPYEDEISKKYITNYRVGKSSGKVQGIYVEEQIQVVTKINQRHFGKGTFYMQALSLDRLIIEKKYNFVELRTLIALKARLDFNNRIKNFKQSDIAKEIGSSQPNVSKALKRLLEDNIILKDGLDYYFSDVYIKGSGDENSSKKEKRRKN
ncbi:MAG: helix-turn-helix domain-containing protein [Treponema sp.]|nr:helix-turn-helix domain-containing protein [Treponema sp.]